MIEANAAAVGRAPSAVRPGSPVYTDVVEFLHDEADLLDSGRFKEWLAQLTEDIEYRMPARLTSRKRDEPGFSDTTDIFADNLASLKVRIARLGTSFAWAEDPPSRTRHFVTNIRVTETEREDELAVRSSLLLYRSRSDQTTPDLFSGERHDLLRRVDGNLRLARRLILLDQTLVNARHLSVLF